MGVDYVGKTLDDMGHARAATGHAVRCGGATDLVYARAGGVFVIVVSVAWRRAGRRKKRKMAGGWDAGAPGGVRLAYVDL